MRKHYVLVLAAVLVVAVAGCGKKEEGKTGPVAGAPAGMGQMPAGGMPPGGMPPAGMGEGMGGGMGAMGGGMGSSAAPKQVVVPDTVKKAWPAAKIMVKKKTGGEEGKVYEVKAGESVALPGSTLKVEVGQYLPDFFMDGQTITSKSDVQINPTVRITVFDGDKEIYKGWAFEKYPEAHAFTNPEYTISLVGGVKGK